MANVDDAAVLTVQVAYAPAPHAVEVIDLTLPAGATVLDALRASGLGAKHGAATIDSLQVGVWGKLKPLETPLRDGDRVELYRALTVDPKEARRQRFRRDGVKRAPR